MGHLVSFLSYLYPILLGFAAGNLGNTWLPNGAVLSLPLTMYFSTKDDLERSGIIKKSYLSRHPDLSNKLIPSSNCNKFRIARELVHLKSNDFLLSAAILPTFCLIACGGFALSNRLKLPTKSLLALNKGLIAFGTICAYHIVTTRVTSWQVYRADRIAASIDPTFMSGKKIHILLYFYIVKCD